MTDKNGPLQISGQIPERFRGFFAMSSAEDQLRFLNDLICEPDNFEEANFALRVFVNGLSHSKRKHWTQAVNKFMHDFKQLDRCFDQEMDIDQLAALIDGPDNSVFVQQFRIRLSQESSRFFSFLVQQLVDEEIETRLLQIARLLQSVAQIGRITDFSEDYKLALQSILANHDGETTRDLTTQVGYLLSLHFPEERFDHTEWQPMPRMSVFRGIVSASDSVDLGECIRFYSQFTETGNAMDLHYAVQSLQLLLTRVFLTKNRSTVPTLDIPTEKSTLSVKEGVTIVEICLFRWEHTWQMVASNCRALFGLVCQVASDDLLGAILEKANRLELGTKKRFNCLFGLIPYLPEIVTENLVNEILSCIRTTCPSIASACQLLQAIFECPTVPDLASVMKSIVRHLHSETDSVTDIEQLMSTVCKASKRITCNHETRHVSPLSVFVNEIMLISRSDKLLLRLVQYSLMSNATVVSVYGDRIRIGASDIFTIEEMRKFILSSDSETVTCAVVIASRLIHAFGKNAIEWYPLLPLFVTGGGVMVVGCCNDDRSIVLQELKRFFEKSIIGIPQKEFFSLLWQEGTRLGALLEETQLPIEVVCGVSHGRLMELIQSESMESVLTNALTSRWRKVRAAARTLFASKSCLIAKTLGIEFINNLVSKLLRKEIECNEELAGSLLDALAQLGDNAGIKTFAKSHILDHSIEQPCVAGLTCLAHATAATVRTVTSVNLENLVRYCVSVVVLHSQFVGENSTESIMTVTEGFLDSYQRTQILSNVFVGKVDCRGHPILNSDEESTALAIKSWTNGKAAALALKAIVESMEIDEDSLSIIAQVSALLLLSVKHPAEIGPLESVFSAVVSRLPLRVVEQELLGPLVACITNGCASAASFSLPAALRRSQGLGPLISSIIKCQPSLVVMGSVCERLLSVINSSQFEDEPTLHSLNILRCLVRDSAVPDLLIEAHIGEILIAAVDVLFRLSADYWRVRSSATQLFVQASRRLIGTDNEEDWIQSGGKHQRSKKCVSAVEFFFNRTKAASRLLEELVHVIHKNDQEYVVVPVLSVLQSLSGLGELENHPHGSRLLSQVENGLRSPSAHVRRLSAKIIVRKLVEAGKSLDKKFQIARDDDANTLHGKLWILNYWLQVSGLSEEETRSILKNLESIWLRTNLAPLVSFALSWAFLRFGKVPQEKEGRLSRFVDTVDDSDVRKSESLATLVLSLFPSVVDPRHSFYGELLVAVISGWPSLMTAEQVEICLSIWFQTKNNIGVAACINFLTENGGLTPEITSSVSQWIDLSINALDENLHEDVKMTLAKSSLVRSNFPDLHMQLLLDESAEVRLAASVDGMNSLASFQHILTRCSSESLLELLTEALGSSENSTKIFAEEQVVDFCIRKIPREIAAVELKRREFSIPAEIIILANKSVNTACDHVSFSRVHASRLVLEFSR